MATFSMKSNTILATCRPDLRRLMREVVKRFDCTIIGGTRGCYEQERLFDEGKSKAHFGESPHNFDLSFAVDVVPYPINWQDRERMTYFAGYVMATAAQLGIALRWGGDWDGDSEVKDNHFDDMPHFELADWRDRVIAG